MSNAKPKWEQPKLIILLKGEPEENVLADCKSTAGMTGPEASYTPCDRLFKGYCKSCNKEGTS